MLPFKRSCFQLAVLVAFGFAPPSIQALERSAQGSGAQAFFSQVESRIESLQVRVSSCLKGGCESDSVVFWVVSRISGGARVVRVLNSRPSWLSEDESTRVLATLGALPAPQARMAGDPPVAMKLGQSGDWSRPLLVFEFATGFPGERLSAVVSAIGFFHHELASGATGTERRWIFWSDGEVIGQSKLDFIGAQFGAWDYFRNRNKHVHDGEPELTRSFDQTDVRPSWKALPDLGLILLHEALPLGTATAPMRLATSTAFWLFYVAAFFASVVLLRKSFLALWRRMVLWQSRSLKKTPVLRPQTISSNDIHLAIYRSRDIRALGKNLRGALSQTTGCEVLFLEFDRKNGVAVEAEPQGDGMRVVLSEMGMVPGRCLLEIPALKSAVLKYRDCASFLAWPLMASRAPGELLGVVIILRPTALVYSLVPSIGAWVERAGRYHQAILAPERANERGVNV